MNRGAPALAILSGIDPTGGAGLALDLRVAQRLGVAAAAVPSCLTVQNRFGFVRGEAITPALLRAMLDAIRDDVTIGVVKIGLCVDAATIESIADWFAALPLPWPALVVDPVLSATAGGGPERVIELAAAIVARLVPLGAIVTPNLPELTALTRTTERERGVAALLDRGAAAVLVKDGHGDGAEVVDVLYGDGPAHVIRHRRITRGPVHGTGCALASGIAARLASGVPLRPAVEQAIDDVVRWIARTAESSDGRPVAIELD